MRLISTSFAFKIQRKKQKQSIEGQSEVDFEHFLFIYLFIYLSVFAQRFKDRTRKKKKKEVVI